MFRIPVAAIARRNGITVRASLGMAEKGADALIELRADDVFEPAGLRVGLGVVNGEGVLEKALCKPMPTHNASCALASHRRQLGFAIQQFHKMSLAHAAQGLCRRPIGKNGKTPGGATCLQRLDIGRFTLFAANPDLFEEMIEANLVVGRSRRAAIGGIG